MRLYNTLADVVVGVHFVSILFMCAGFITAIIGLKIEKLLQLVFLRIFHLAGIIYMGLNALLDKPCLLTTLENYLRAKYSPGLIYTEVFIIHYLKKLIYPDINPVLITMITGFAAVLSIIIFVIKPPGEVKRIFKKLVTSKKNLLK